VPHLKDPRSTKPQCGVLIGATSLKLAIRTLVVTCGKCKCINLSAVPAILTVLPAPTVTYQYRTKASTATLIHVTQVKQVVAAGVTTEDYDYDSEGRVNDRKSCEDCPVWSAIQDKGRRKSSRRPFFVAKLGSSENEDSILTGQWNERRFRNATVSWSRPAPTEPHSVNSHLTSKQTSESFIQLCGDFLNQPGGYMKRNSPVHSRRSGLSQDHKEIQLRSRRFKSKPRSKTLAARLLLPAILLIVLWSLLISAYSGNALRQVVPLVTLQSAERILETAPSISALGAASSVNDKQIYALRRDTPNISTYDVERKRSKEVLSFGRATKALAIGPQGRIYLASESEVRVLDSTGQSLGSFSVPNPTSLAVSGNGDVVVSAADSGKLLHVYDQGRKSTKKFR
jgi:hypothetical protein